MTLDVLAQQMAHMFILGVVTGFFLRALGTIGGRR